ncbi:hypothetical protein [Candidatus Uabimicrobium sp. HlEnr_7]|uniref:hypothetical protein n=1 Tax=Candidatus Uabimicrobium helgolandensis TaxID=3095367 RepID=UPI003555C068
MDFCRNFLILALIVLFTGPFVTAETSNRAKSYEVKIVNGQLQIIAVHSRSKRAVKAYTHKELKKYLKAKKLEIQITQEDHLDPVNNHFAYFIVGQTQSKSRSLLADLNVSERIEIQRFNDQIRVTCIHSRSKRRAKSGATSELKKYTKELSLDFEITKDEAQGPVQGGFSHVLEATLSQKQRSSLDRAFVSIDIEQLGNFVRLTCIHSRSKRSAKAKANSELKKYLKGKKFSVVQEQDLGRVEQGFSYLVEANTLSERSSSDIETNAFVHVDIKVFNNNITVTCIHSKSKRRAKAKANSELKKYAKQKKLAFEITKDEAQDSTKGFSHVLQATLSEK